MLFVIRKSSHVTWLTYLLQIFYFYRRVLISTSGAYSYTHHRSCQSCSSESFSSVTRSISLLDSTSQSTCQKVENWLDGVPFFQEDMERWLRRLQLATGQSQEGARSQTLPTEGSTKAKKGFFGRGKK